MGRLHVEVYNTDYTLKAHNLQLEPTSYSWHNIGGPEGAQITAWGNARQVWETSEWLRCPVQIIDEQGEIIWWGIINKSTVRVGAIAVTVALDNMNNRVATTYVTPGADERSTTDWVEDGLSTSRYGYKEMLLSMGEGGAAQAVQLRDLQLEERKWPTPMVDHTPADNSLSATLECVGWYETLRWRYCQDLTGEESYKFEGLGTQYVGDVASCMEVRGSFKLPDNVDAWGASTLWLKMRKANAPSSNAFVTLSTSTWSVLTSGSVAPSDMGPNHAWIEYILAPSVVINPSTLYYIRFHGASDPDLSNYYVVNINEELSYPRGDFRLWNKNTDTWNTRSPDADMEFKVLGTTPNDQQIITCASRAGQFFSNVTVSPAASLISYPYKNGDVLAHDIMDTLLQAGTANHKHYRAHVTPDRWLQVTEEPDFDAASCYQMNGMGEITFRGKKIEYQPPVGNWCMLIDILPGNLDLNLIFDPSKFYIERATYTVSDNALRLEPRGAAEIYAVVKGG